MAYMSETPKNTTGNEKKSTGVTTPTRQGLYALVASHSKEAIHTLYDLMKNAHQESVRMGASRALLDKALPDLKAMEVSGREGNDLKLIVKIIDEKHDSELADS